jgi:hypothetical protein
MRESDFSIVGFLPVADIHGIERRLDSQTSDVGQKF